MTKAEDEAVAHLEHFEELKRYVRFGEEDARCLVAFREIARPQFKRIARAFYERAREHDEAHAVFESEAQIRRLHVSLVGWLERVLGGVYDQEYCEKSARIGHVHVRIGLPQRFMFSAMTLFRDELHQISRESLGDAAAVTSRAIDRVLDIELALMNDTYLHAAVARLGRLEREREEKAVGRLTQAQRATLLAIDSTGLIVIGTNDCEEIVSFNRAAEELTGYAADEATGWAMRELLVADADTCLWRHAVETPTAIEDDDEMPAVCAVRTRTGKVRSVEASVVHLGQRGQTAINWVFVGRDVTASMGRQLSWRRQERLAAVGTLAAGLAHEIRNPLNGALLHTRLVERGLAQDGDKELASSAAIVKSEIDRLTQLVNEFLLFARPQAIERSRACVKALCSHSAEMVRPRADEHGVSLSLELPESELAAEIDAPRIEQVLLNLLHNAIDASAEQANGHPSSGVLLRLTREPRHARIEVHDDGAGIPEKTPIFDAFYSTKPRGTGLGLSIAHRIVSDHHGEIEGYNSERGAVFLMRLPLEDPETLHDKGGAP